MTDAEYCFLVLVGFYFGEALFWVRAGTFVFCTHFGGWRQRRINLRWALLRNPEGGLVVGNLLPWGQASICQQWSLSLSPQGAYGFVSQALSKDGRPSQPERFVRYENIRKVEAQGHNLLINGVLFVRTAAPSFARLLARAIRRLAALPEAERGPVIDALLAQHLDADEVLRRLTLFRSLSAELQITCSLLFFLIFLLPPLLAQFDAHFPLGAFLGSYAGLAGLAALQFHRAHAALHPEETFERWKQTCVMLVSPADVVHARDKLARWLLAEHHPLAVAWVVNAPASFAEFAGEAWRDLTYPTLPVCPALDPGPRETEAWFRERLRAQIGRFLDAAGLCLDEMLSPPAPEDATSRSYCPRCRGQYVLEAGNCGDCARPLKAWGDAPSTSS